MCTGPGGGCVGCREIPRSEAPGRRKPAETKAGMCSGSSDDDDEGTASLFDSQTLVRIRGGGSCHSSTTRRGTL
jgi:hypothetical protein